MKYPPVLTKRDFVARYRNGEFGNAAPTWDSYHDWSNRTSPITGLFHIRNRVAGGPTYYDVPAKNVGDRWFDLVNTGVDPSSLYISAMAPTAKTLIQGEVVQWEQDSLRLTYTYVRKPMRDALAESTNYACGIMVVSLLRYYLCPNSYEWLSLLLTRYPLHVVEFSTYSQNWGTLPNFNTVFWEVRRY